jgi:hypothetical protein
LPDIGLFYRSEIAYIDEMGEVVEILETSSPGDIFMVVDESLPSLRWQCRAEKCGLGLFRRLGGVRRHFYPFVPEQGRGIDDVVVSDWVVLDAMKK